MALVIYIRDFIHTRSAHFNSLQALFGRTSNFLQIIFLFCGSLTVAFSIIILWVPTKISILAKLIDMCSIVMPDSPMEAKFLKGDDKLIAIERLRANQMGVASRVWKWDHLLESFLDMKTWFWFAMIFSIS